MPNSPHVCWFHLGTFWRQDRLPDPSLSEVCIAGGILGTSGILGKDFYALLGAPQTLVVRVICEYREGKKDGDPFLRDCNGHPIIQKFDLTVTDSSLPACFGPPPFSRSLKHLLQTSLSFDTWHSSAGFPALAH